MVQAFFLDRGRILVELVQVEALHKVGPLPVIGENPHLDKFVLEGTVLAHQRDLVHGLSALVGCVVNYISSVVIILHGCNERSCRYGENLCLYPESFVSNTGDRGTLECS